jgi:two-component system chemotaxis sensor kinase CheA
VNDSLLEQYLVESRECLDEADKSLLALEREPHATPLIDALFRALHTLKGGAGLFDFAPITKLTHAAESALGQVREHQSTLTPPLISMLFEVLDSLNLWLEIIEAGEQLDNAATERSRILVQGLAPFLPVDVVLPTSPVDTDFSWAADLPEAAWLDAATRRDDARTTLVYTPDEGCFFSGEDPLAFMRTLPGLLALHLETPQPLPRLDAIETYHCYLKFFALSAATPTELETYCRAVAEQVSFAPLLTPLAAQPSLLPMFRQVVEAQLQILDLPQTAQSRPRIPGIIQVLRNALTFTKNTAALALLDTAASLAKTDANYAPLRSLLHSLLNDAPPVENSTPDGPATQTPLRTKAANPKWIKVEQAKIDQLLDLLGELAVAQNGLLLRLDENHMQTLIAQVRERHGRMQGTLQDLQDLGLSLRMLPLSQVLQRLPRLTRDLAQQLGKQVRLEIEGEDTEADKRVVENLAEPLLHIVRNSIGHGIESVAERTAAGKLAEGLISVRAFHRGEQVVIEIQDDGKGMDAVAIKKKAIAQKLIKQELAEKLTSEALLQLVFLPGFSTAEAVSEVAGRGVGMDVVKSVVESVGGQVAISSQVGKGTTITLSLPVDIALTKIMTVDVAGQLFGIPMAHVRHTLRSPRSALRRIKKKQAFAFREQILPLFHLRELLALPEAQAPAPEVAIVVVETPRGQLGLAVDALAEPNNVVVKPMAGILRGLSQYAGNALLPDGSILLVLDMREVFSLAH